MSADYFTSGRSLVVGENIAKSDKRFTNKHSNEARRRNSNIKYCVVTFWPSLCICT